MEEDQLSETITKQEKNLPDDQVIEMGPNVLRIQLPCDMPGLGHVNCYVIEDNAGVTVVDPGFPYEKSIAILQKRLAEISVPVARVHTVVITHSHPDHYGGAAWLQDQSGAEVITHARFSSPFAMLEQAVAGGASCCDWSDSRLSPWDDAPWGGDPGLSLTDLDEDTEARFQSFSQVARPTRRVRDREVLRLGDRDWFVVHTPGHTDDHICLFDPTEGLLMTGDHVLPTISPNINGVAEAEDPLGSYLHSLAKVGALGPQVRTALPAHGNSFDALKGRVDEIADHHRERLQVILDTVGNTSDGASIGEMSEDLFLPRSRGRVADTETFAHAEHLRIAGILDRRTDRDGLFRYTLTDR